MSKKPKDSKRNFVRQSIIQNDGTVKNIFHQKTFNGGSFKSWWDILNKNKKPKSKRQKILNERLNDLIKNKV